MVLCGIHDITSFVKGPFLYWMCNLTAFSGVGRWGWGRGKEVIESRSLTSIQSLLTAVNLPTFN